MANEEHLAILKKGVKEWNKWRKDNPDITPDLNRAYLGGANFSGVNLSGANLSGANLIRADLSKADLSKVSLIETDLSHASLYGANLSGANLSGAHLVGADLSGADLSETDLREADLRGAVLADNSSSMVNFADFSNSDLRKAILTPEGGPIGAASFLDLGSCEGIETAKFEPGFLEDYLIKAFEYAHKPGIEEAKEWPKFVERAIKNIRALRKIYGDGEQLPEQVIEVVKVISGELMKYLKKHPEAMHKIRPRQFEELIAEILASYGWDVRLTPAIKDGGYDIFGVSKDIAGVETSWIIECKKYAPENKVGGDIVRALYGVKSDLKVANALLATTSYFTKGVKDYKASRYDIDLKDYEGILEWINEYSLNPDGKLYIKNNKLILPGEN